MCQGIRYEIDAELGEILYCHCQRCRKANGTAFATNAPVPVEKFTWLQGEHLLKKYPSSETTQRCFCGVCGSPIISIKTDTPDFYRLRIGTLDTPIQARPSRHIFVASQAEWDNICDSLPQYPERP